MQAVDINNLTTLAKKAEPTTRILFNKIKRRPPRNLDSIVHDLHATAFENFDCLQCANCCKTISPRITDNDIDKLAKHLKIKPSKLVEQYLYLDSDGDYVVQQTPCPFLGSDNYCAVYEHRPRACREYPHTDRRKFYQLLPITLKNTYICPVVYKVVELLKLSLSQQYTIIDD